MGAHPLLPADMFCRLPPFPSLPCAACQELVTLRPGEPIKCNKCGGRILYKLRTKNVVQYEAR